MDTKETDKMIKLKEYELENDKLKLELQLFEDVKNK